MQCPQCQTENRAGRRFCAECGVPLAMGASPPDPRSASPESYTPRHLAEKILTSRSALEGERKQVTVFFCDLANSTPLAARLGPERMHRLLNQFFELALDEGASLRGHHQSVPGRRLHGLVWRSGGA